MNKKMTVIMVFTVGMLCQLDGMANSEGMKKIRADAAAQRAAEQQVQTPTQQPQQQPQQPASNVARPRIK